MLRCIAIDDEPLALEQLARFIKRIPELDLVGAFYSVEEAEEATDISGLDLMFLDIDMPDCSGTEFARRIGREGRTPCIIFTTAYPQYAAEGFRLDAVDYLLKPLSFADLQEAVGKVRRRLRSNAETTTQPDDSLYIKVNGAIRRIAPDDILFIKGLGEYVQIHVEGQQAPLVTLESMHRLEKSLAPRGFMRIHRSYIINLSKVNHAGRNQIVIADTPLPIGDTYRKQVTAYFQSRVNP